MPLLVAVADDSDRTGAGDGAELLATRCFSPVFSTEVVEDLAADCRADGGTACCSGVGFTTTGAFCGVAATGKGDVAEGTGLFSGFAFSFRTT